MTSDPLGDGIDVATHIYNEVLDMLGPPPGPTPDLRGEFTTTCNDCGATATAETLADAIRLVEHDRNRRCGAEVHDDDEPDPAPKLAEVAQRERRFVRRSDERQ